MKARAVQKYEKYAEETMDRLIKAYIEKGAERTVAESLAMQVFEEIGLGNIAVGQPAEKGVKGKKSVKGNPAFIRQNFDIEDICEDVKLKMPDQPLDKEITNGKREKNLGLNLKE